MAAYGIYYINNVAERRMSEFSETKKTEIVVSSSSYSIMAGSFRENPSSDNQNDTNSAPKKVVVESGYSSYDQSKLANAEYGKVILFFHASWCSSCKALEDDIKANLDEVPDDVLILKVDYDSNTELRSKYQIRMQHTLVQVDKNGDLVSSDPGLYQLGSLDSILKAFKVS